MTPRLPAAPEAGALAARLAAIGAALRDWRALWSGHAFREPRLDWEDAHPGLARALRALSPQAAEALHADTDAADTWLGTWLPVADWRALEQVAPLPARAGAPAWPRDIARDVPGRKWRQVEAFVAALEPLPAARLVDWCAGKSHLGRALAACFPGVPVLALERDPALAAQGPLLARRAGLVLEALCCDVFGAGAAECLDERTHACALHACGHLHLHLFELAAERRPLAISCAPCCYHLAGSAGTRPLSDAGRAAWPGFAVEDLRTAVQETVTADGHVRRRRRRLQQWQLGFDALARELRGVDAYLPLPAVGAAVLDGDFAGFCRLLAGRKALALPARTDFAGFEAIGRRRFAEVTALDLVRQRFRRLIELCVVLDRALFLEDRGYRVTLGSFCPREVSPRNLLLHARRAA